MPEMIPNPAPRHMPTKRMIKANWEPYLLLLEKFDSPEELWEDDYCFACGLKPYATSKTERAHIIPRVYGGDDTVDNLHLLCKKCHRYSEFFCERMKDKSVQEVRQYYFQWLEAMSPWHGMALHSPIETMNYFGITPAQVIDFRRKHGPDYLPDWSQPS